MMYLADGERIPRCSPRTAGGDEQPRLVTGTLKANPDRSHRGRRTTPVDVHATDLQGAERMTRSTRCRPSGIGIRRVRSA